MYVFYYWKDSHVDINVSNRPEAYGVISGAMFLMITFVFIPLRFYDTLAFNKALAYHQVSCVAADRSGEYFTQLFVL